MCLDSLTKKTSLNLNVFCVHPSVDTLYSFGLQRQKEAYEQRRAVYEKRRAAMAEEAEKRRELRAKQAEFFRRQQEELAAEAEKWRNDYWNRGQSQTTEEKAEEKSAGKMAQEPAAESVKKEATPETKEPEVRLGAGLRWSPFTFRVDVFEKH